MNDISEFVDVVTVSSVPSSGSVDLDSVETGLELTEQYKIRIIQDIPTREIGSTNT